MYEDIKEVEKDVITASADLNDIPYVYKAKKPKTTWLNPLDSCIVRTAGGLASRKSATYGKVRDGGTRNHQGVDFLAAPGTPIKAIADGKVIVINESYSIVANLVLGHI